MQNLTGDGVRLQPLIYLLIRQDCEQSPTVVLQSAPAAVRQARAGSGCERCTAFQCHVCHPHEK